MIRYKRKFEFHQKLTTTWNATNFWISNVHYTTSLDSLLIFVVGPNFSMTLLKMICCEKEEKEVKGNEKY